MASGKQTAPRSLVRELLQPYVYKRTQGRWTRQVTGLALCVAVALGAWSFNQYFAAAHPALRLWVPMVILVAGCWLAYRVVNMPRFADFLIAVEAEMNKVSWPTRSELWRSSLVVMATIFVLAAILTIYDFFWITIFQTLLGI